MSKITEQDVEKIAHLARLGINQQDIPKYAQSLSEILNFVEQMDNVDTSQVSAMAHPQDMLQRLRDDIVTEQEQRELLMKNAQETENGLFLVPKVIE